TDRAAPVRRRAVARRAVGGRRARGARGAALGAARVSGAARRRTARRIRRLADRPARRRGAEEPETDGDGGRGRSRARAGAVRRSDGDVVPARHGCHVPLRSGVSGNRLHGNGPYRRRTGSDAAVRAGVRHVPGRRRVRSVLCGASRDGSRCGPLCAGTSGPPDAGLGVDAAIPANFGDSMTTIVHVIGARPNYMKIAPLMEALKTGSPFRQVLVNTGQHYDDIMSRAFVRDLGLPSPDYDLGVGSGSHAAQTAAVMVEFEKVCLAERPDLVVVVGDVNSTVAASLVAAKLLVPVAHVEAGLRSRDRTMPEEVNRIVTD